MIAKTAAWKLLLFLQKAFSIQKKNKKKELD